MGSNIKPIMETFEIQAYVNAASEIIASQKRDLIPQDGGKAIKRIVSALSEKSGLTPQEIGKEIRVQEEVYNEVLPIENYNS